MMIFLKREFRESNLFVVVSEKIDPLKVLLFFLCLKGVANFFCKFWRREEFAFFSQKIVRKTQRREKSRRETF